MPFFLASDLPIGHQFFISNSFGSRIFRYIAIIVKIIMSNRLQKADIHSLKRKPPIRTRTAPTPPMKLMTWSAMKRLGVKSGMRARYACKYS